MTIQIRDALRSDKDKIVSFQVSMAMETEKLQLRKNIVEKGVEAIFEDNAKGAYYIAEIGNKVVGSLLTTFEWSDWRNGQIIWIQSVFVEKAYRGNGVFSKLYEHIKSKVIDPESEYRGVRLYVDKSNLAAQQVYQKLGMSSQHYDTYEWLNDIGH